MTKPTMRDVAKHANVSVATVSRVINLPHLTSDRAQLKVHQVIEELGYDTTQLLKPKAPKYHHKKILVIDNQLFSNSQINKGLESSAKAAGYKLLYLRFLYFTDYETQQIIHYTLNHKVDGIIFINDSPYLHELQKLITVLPPLVVLNYFSLDYSCLYFDHLTIAFKATEYLLQQGHNRIACLIPSREKQSNIYIQQGYTQALNRLGHSFNIDYFIEGCCTFESGRLAVKTLMKSRQPPTALICFDSTNLNYLDEDCFIEASSSQPSSEQSLLKGVLYQIKKLGLVIPGHLSIMHTTHLQQHEVFTEPLLTHIHKPLYKMGEEGFALLLTKLKSYSVANTSKLIPTELVIRHSVLDKTV